VTSRTLTLGGTAYPLVLPTIRDPRLHVAGVILSVHLLGQLGLGFRVSVPQILAAILTCAVIEVVLTFRQSRTFVWPASAMLTGSGIALILRVDTPAGDHWSFAGWYLFAAIAGLSLLTKYLIRYRGVHVFNPSNIGLVLAFLLLGSSVVEPLDFWWAPLDPWMIAAYIIIIGGGTLITRRLHLAAMAGIYWIVLAIGMGLLAASGHCMTARWSFSPVCGVDFWRVIVTSPEVMIFLFFMITDPRTVPASRVGRLVFALTVAIASALLIAPQTHEFGAKVGLLSGLFVISAARPFFERVFPEPRSAADDLRLWARRLLFGEDGRAGLARAATSIGLVGMAVLVVGVGIVAAGGPARGVVVADPKDVLGRVPHEVDPTTLPAITVEPDVADFDHTMNGAGGQEVVVTLAENLELENQALLRGDAAILDVVDHGDRLVEMQDRLRQAGVGGVTAIDRYRIDSVHISLLLPFGMQTSLSLGLASRGEVVRETYDASGTLLSQQAAPFEATFVLRRVNGERWLNVAVLPPASG
jgi:Na+-translocating ferredoxin:NAD+ oxidoreductase RnfD subunit